MNCPKCNESVSKDDNICRNCGTVLRSAKKNKKGLLAIGTSKKESSPKITVIDRKSGEARADAKKWTYMRYGLIGGVILLIVILIIILVVHVASGKGKKTAKNLAEYIGSRVTNAEKDLDIHLKDNSEFAVINKMDTFDYIIESEDKIEIDDTSFPEWTVSVLKTDSEKIEQVIYTDYRVLKSDSRGEKLDKRIDLDKYDKQTKISTILDDIDFDPFRITYDVSFTKYEFRYYYKLDNGDMQSVILCVSADSNDKFIFYTSEDIYPFYYVSE
ncbi:MAG: zinc ribbon domain-containing protein [Ruminococcus sp.]|nr:zinc ribbon domain-containing protein [Ruminococcus sp.]